MRSRWIRRVAVLALLVAAAATLRLTVFRPDPVPVTVYRVAVGRVEASVTNSRAGTVKSRRRATLSPETGGRIEEILVTEGDRVSKGDVLLRLASRDARARVELEKRSLDAARAREVEAEATATRAARDLERFRELARDRIVAESVLDQYRSASDVASAALVAAKAVVEQSKAALDVARVQLERTVLRAPFDGIVAEIDAEIGEWITPSPPGVPIPAVMEVFNPEAIYVSAPMDEVDVGKVRPGQAVRVTFDSYPGEALPGKVIRVAPYVLDLREQNRTFDIEVALDDEEFARSLLPGTSADVEVVLDSRDGVLRVPSYAILEGSHVFVVHDDALESRAVETGLRNWAFTEIQDGLERGEVVVVSLDRAEVTAGARVRVEAETDR